MILSDFHTHSSNSGDCDVKMQLQVESAINKGLKNLCITEHLDLDYPLSSPDGTEYCDFSLDADAYLNEYIQMKEKYQSGDFKLFFGIEVGLQPQVVAENNEYLTKKPFDFVIASSHLLDNCDPYYPEFWADKKDSDVFRQYLQSIYENICLFSNFDVYGHLDYIVRYRKDKDKDFNYYEFSDEIDLVLNKLIEMGKGIEVNTGGLKNGMKYPNPCPDIIKRYRDLGGEILTIGSDAHSPEYIAYSFHTLPDLLKECGFDYYTIFSKRKPEFIKI